jgi:hypothetical protein
LKQIPGGAVEGQGLQPKASSEFHSVAQLVAKKAGWGGSAMANLLTNGDFEALAAAPTTLVGVSLGGQSAAPSWTTWNNADAVTTTDILPSTAPGAGAQMLHVCTTGQGCGLVQQYQATDTGPAQITSSVSIFVVRGEVGMGTGNGGNTSANDAVSIVTGSWEQLTAPNGVSPANEFIVYAVSAGGACYYVDNASVNEMVPKY